MHIGIIAPEFPPETGGMQMVALRIAEQLAARHEVTVCTMQGLQHLSCEFRTIANLRGKPDQDKNILNKLDVDIWLAMNAGYASIADKLSKPLIAYFHGNDFLDPWITARSTSMKILTTIPLVRRFLRPAIRRDAQAHIGRGMAHCHQVIANSAHTKALIREQYGNGHDIVVCAPGVSPTFFQPRRNSPDGEPRALKLLTVSRLAREARRKNIDGVLRGLAALTGQLQFEYVIVGEGNDRKNLERLCRNLGLRNSVKFLGRAADSDLVELYRWADLFVLPVKASGLDVEGFGLVYLEAAASGLPALCSQAGGATEAVIDGETGIILRSSEPAAIAEGILRFARTKQIFQPERIQAFASRFTWENAAAIVEAELLRCVTSQVPLGEGLSPAIPVA